MNTERFIRLPEVCEKLAIGKSTVWAWANDGRLPKGIKLSSKVTVWKLSEIEAAMAKLALQGGVI